MTRMSLGAVRVWLALGFGLALLFSMLYWVASALLVESSELSDMDHLFGVLGAPIGSWLAEAFGFLILGFILIVFSSFSLGARHGRAEVWTRLRDAEARGEIRITEVTNRKTEKKRK